MGEVRILAPLGHHDYLDVDPGVVQVKIDSRQFAQMHHIGQSAMQEKVLRDIHTNLMTTLRPLVDRAFKELRGGGRFDPETYSGAP